MRRGVPSVEVADDAHLLGIRRPHREVHAKLPVDLALMRAELLVGAMQRTFVEEMQIVFGEHA